MQDVTPKVEQSQRQDLQALFQTSQVISGSLELYSIFNNLLLTTMGKLLVSKGLALLYDQQHLHWHVALAKGVSTIEEGASLELPELTSGALIAGKELPEKLDSMGMHLLFPLRDDQATIGAIALGKKVTGGAFEEDELQFVQSLVNMSSTSVRNSLIMDELRQTNIDLDSTVRQLNTLFELSTEFNKTVDRAHVLKIFSFALMGQMVVQKYLFYLRRPDHSFELVSGNESNLLGLPQEFLIGIEDLVLSSPENILEKHGIVLALPIRQQDIVHGVLCLGPKPDASIYDQKDIEFLYALGSLAVTSIQNVELIESRIAKQRMEEELRTARDIQRRLLPDKIPDIPGLEVSTLSLSSREVGGDYFDVALLNRDRTMFMIADVTGKGVPAALLMSSIHACTHIMLPMQLSLQEAIEHTNRVLYENTDPDIFITAFAAIYYPDKSFSFVNAGHEPPLLVRANGNIEYLREGGTLLGILPNTSYDSGEITLSSNDVIVMFTDGVTEAMGEAMEEYSPERLVSLVKSNYHISASALTELIQNDIQDFTGPVETLSDDRTLIVIKATA